MSRVNPFEVADISDYVLTIPAEVYARARQIAEETSQPVNQMMIEYLRTLSAPLPTLSPEEKQNSMR